MILTDKEIHSNAKVSWVEILNLFSIRMNVNFVYEKINYNILIW